MPVMTLYSITYWRFNIFGTQCCTDW